MSITEKILCSKSHEYILKNEDGTYTIGLTDYAVEQLGDIVYTEVNETLADAPETLNEDSYEKGWLIKAEATGDITEQNDLMEYEDYKEEVE